MALFLKINPVGIDVAIQKIQIKIEAPLALRWSTDPNGYNCYGRAYRNQDKDGRYFPEVYLGNQEYGDPGYNDKVVATSFFGVDDRMEYIGGKTFKANCWIIFSIDIHRAKPGIIHRADEEIHSDVMVELRKALPNDTITMFVTGIDNVFREYDGYWTNNGIRFTDIHPKHCFRVNFELTFINNHC